MKLFLPFSLILFCAASYGQTTIPKQFKKAVAYIYVEDDSGRIVPNGTGFYIGTPVDSTHLFPYIVTARHVLRKSDGSYHNKIYVRTRRLKDSVMEFLPTILVYTSKNHNVFLHPDTTVDVAVIEGAPDSKSYEVGYIPTSIFVSRESFDSLNIQEGDEVFFTGMFTQFLGQKNNYAISRFGRIALITDEKVFWNGNYRNLYLIEATTYWGNSGAPVYFALKTKPKPRPNMIITGTITSFKLAGIMSGFFGDNIFGGFVETKSIKPYSLVNYGISAVTPSYFVLDILNSDEAKKSRATVF